MKTDMVDKPSMLFFFLHKNGEKVHIILKKIDQDLNISCKNNLYVYIITGKQDNNTDEFVILCPNQM